MGERGVESTDGAVFGSAMALVWGWRLWVGFSVGGSGGWHVGGMFIVGRATSAGSSRALVYTASV